MLRNVFIIVFLSISTSLIAQPCKDYMKKERGGNLETKHQRLGMVLTTRIMFYLRNEGSDNELVYYAAEGKAWGTDAFVSAGMDHIFDSVLVDLKFRTGDEINLRCASKEAELEAMSLRGAANNHFPMEITDEHLALLASEQVNEFRVMMFNEGKLKDEEERKWKKANPGEARAFMNGAKCFMDEVE